MDTDLKNTNEDAEMADCDGEKVVTMMDVLQEQEDFEEDANAVLGASDEKNCTFSKGYIKRQAIYACMTCCSDAKDDLTKRAGVCLACSLTCHENHDLIELYTKRNFKCDCGNPKFNSHPCQFTPNKTDLNEENSYNQNFSGVYCVCQRPHPDPESMEDVEMIQCTICEDWLHASHLEASLPDNDQYSEMICKGCMEKNDFLHDYSNLAVNIDVDVVTNGIDNDSKICNGDIKLDTVKGEIEEATDVEMIEKVETNISEKSTDETISKDGITESDVDSKNGENTSDIMESTNETNGNKESVGTNSDKIEESSEKDENEDKKPDDTRDNIVEETIKDICLLTGNIENDVDNQNESSINSEQQNENKEPTSDTKQTETVKENEKPESIKKSAEQLEEERLLADPETKPVEAENTKNDTEEAKIDNTDIQNEGSVTEKSDSTEAEAVTTEVKMVENGIEAKEATSNNINHNGEIEQQINEKITEKRKLSTEENSDTDIKKGKFDIEPCVRPKGVQKVYKGATFWPSTFRQSLCSCRECITMYKDLSVLFLIDPEDTVTAYENLGKEKIDGKPVSQYEKGLQALSSLDRIQQINALTEYNKMRDKLLDFLKSFKDRKEVVKEEDIKAFFAGMKPKREPDGVYFCR